MPEAAKRGLDPNVWFHNVEYVAAEKIGAETVTYVANIYKYYIAYTLIMEARADRVHKVHRQDYPAAGPGPIPERRWRISLPRVALFSVRQQSKTATCRVRPARRTKSAAHS
jgi:hypothetical protein